MASLLRMPVKEWHRSTYSDAVGVWLDELVFGSQARGSRARVDAQLIVDGGQVGSNGARTDNELFGDLGVGETLCHETQHLYLASGQSCRIGGRSIERWSWRRRR